MQTMGVARMTLSNGAAGELAGVRRRSLDGLSGRLAAGAHTSRAYLAGLGTTGCLLACAGLLFLVASAIVSFSGWPQVGAPSSPVPVTVPADRASGGSHDRPGARRRPAGNQSRGLEGELGRGC